MAATRDLYHRIHAIQEIIPGAKTNATINGATIDTSEFESLTFIWDVGVWTDGTHTLKLQDAPDVAGSSDHQPARTSSCYSCWWR